MESRESIKERLAGVRQEIEKIMRIGGAPGVAIAVIHDGELLHQDYIGFRDITQKKPVDAETVFPCASLTKAVVSAAVGMCVEEGKFGWDTPVKEILPEFHTRDQVLHHHMTPVDCLSHRAGMQASLYWLGSMNNVLIAQENSMNFVNDLQRVKPFRGQYLYNNLGYELAAHILARVTSAPWEQILHRRIFEPLGMTRTGTNIQCSTGNNVAKTYTILDDTTPIEVPPMRSGDDTVGGPGSAMRSCIKDLVKLYSSFLKAGKDQFSRASTSSPGSPLVQVEHLWSARVAMRATSLHETSYALGWARVQTPGPMGAIGLNPDLLLPKPVPHVARDHPSELILYHQGSMPGNLAAVNLIPGKSGAIVVLTNSLALNDTADWIGELLLEAYLGVRNRNDYVSLAQETAAAALMWYPRLKAELESKRIRGTSPRELVDYTGTFFNAPRTMMIKIVTDDQDSTLKLVFQGLESEVFTLNHYHQDIFTWLAPRDDLARRGRFTNQNAEYYKISFGCGNEKGDITFLTWWHDKELPVPEEFTKDSFL